MTTDEVKQTQDILDYKQGGSDQNSKWLQKCSYSTERKTVNRQPELKGTLTLGTLLAFRSGVGIAYIFNTGKRQEVKR